MSKADIAILLFALFGAWRGYKDGFLMGFITMIALVLGVFVAFKLTGEGVVLLHDEYNADTHVFPYITFFIILVLVVVGVTWLGKAMRSSIDKTFLGRVDEIFGSVLGAFKTLFTLSVLLWIADSFKVSVPSHLTEGSYLYPFTVHLAPTLARWLAAVFPFLKEIFPAF